MTDDFYTALGHRIKVARVDAGLDQKDVAHRTGLSRSYVSRIERGEARPGVKPVAEIARALDVTMDHLAGG